MKAKIEMVIAFFKSKFFWRLLLLIALLGFIVVGFNISYDKNTGKFSCTKSEIDMHKIKGGQDAK